MSKIYLPQNAVLKEYYKFLRQGEAMPMSSFLINFECDRTNTDFGRFAFCLLKASPKVKQKLWISNIFKQFMTGEIRSQNYHALNFIVIALESRSYNNDMRTFVRSRKMSSKNSFLRKSNSIQSCSKICSYSYVRSLDHINTRIGTVFLRWKSIVQFITQNHYCCYYLLMF